LFLFLASVALGNAGISSGSDWNERRVPLHGKYTVRVREERVLTGTMPKLVPNSLLARWNCIQTRVPGLFSTRVRHVVSSVRHDYRSPCTTLEHEFLVRDCANSLFRVQYVNISRNIRDVSGESRNVNVRTWPRITRRVFGYYELIFRLKAQVVNRVVKTGREASMLNGICFVHLNRGKEKFRHWKVVKQSAGGEKVKRIGSIDYIKLRLCLTQSSLLSV